MRRIWPAVPRPATARRRSGHDGRVILRLLSYNVRSLRDDASAVARVIRAAQPDVVCVQEAPRFLRWRSKCAGLARRSGLVVVCGGRWAGANLMLSTLAVDVDDCWEIEFTKELRLHQRGTALAVLRKGGERFAVAGTHLDLTADARLRHVAELRAEVARRVPADVPLIVAGDINEKPGEPAWSALCEVGADSFAAAGVGDGSSYPARRASQRIDGVFVDPRARVLSVSVLHSADVDVASDHRPVLVEVALGG